MNHKNTELKFSKNQELRTKNSHCEAMPQHLFGTDGIRGTANLEPITPEKAFRLGRAAGYLFGLNENLFSQSTEAANNCVAPVQAASQQSKLKDEDEVKDKSEKSNASTSTANLTCREATAPSAPCSSSASATLKTGSETFRTARSFVIIGKDTRHSGTMLEAALVAGLHSIGVDALLTGILPTPGVALLTRHHQASAGIVISASHNRAEDNGLKLFRGDGYKLDDAQEARLEELILTTEIDHLRPVGAALGTTHFLSDALERYTTSVKASVPDLSLTGIKIAVDAANGAAFVTTPKILRELGAEVFLFHAAPNGMNINEACGSTHGEEIRRLTLKSGAHLGLSHDGDADRLLLCDEQGNLIDGDEILAMTALEALRHGKLHKNTLVATVMSNFGLDECLKTEGGKVLRTAVGDRSVMEAMLQGNFNIGGEQSGHLIFRDYSTTGDGIVAALQVLQLLVKTGKPLSALRTCLKKYPQAQRNLHVTAKSPLESLTTVTPLIAQTEQELQGKGRLLLRYSGTEPLLRLLIEGPDEALINQQCDRIIEALKKIIV